MGSSRTSLALMVFEAKRPQNAKAARVINIRLNDVTWYKRVEGLSTSDGCMTIITKKKVCRMNIEEAAFFPISRV